MLCVRAEGSTNLQAKGESYDVLVLHKMGKDGLFSSGHEPRFQFQQRFGGWHWWSGSILNARLFSVREGDTSHFFFMQQVEL